MGTKDKASMTPEDKKMVMEMCKQFNGMSLIMKAEVMKCKSPELKQALMKAKDVCAPPGHGGKGSGSGGKKPDGGKGSGSGGKKPEDGPANPVCAAALKMVGGMSKNKDTKDKASMTPEDKKMVMDMCKEFNGMSQVMKAEVMKCKSPEIKQALMKAKDTFRLRQKRTGVVWRKALPLRNGPLGLKAIP